MIVQELGQHFDSSTKCQNHGHLHLCIILMNCTSHYNIMKCMPRYISYMVTSSVQYKFYKDYEFQETSFGCNISALSFCMNNNVACSIINRACLILLSRGHTLWYKCKFRPSNSILHMYKLRHCSKSWLYSLLV